MCDLSYIKAASPAKHLVKRVKGVSPILATVILVLISVALALILYGFTTGNIRLSTPSEGAAVLVIDEVALLRQEGKPSYAYGISVYVRNVGSGDALIRPNSLLILKDGKVVAQGMTLTFDSKAIRVKPGEIAAITYYINALIPGGEYVIKLIPRSGTAAVARVSLKCEIIGKSVIHVVNTTNDGSSPVRSEDAYAIYRTWCSQEGGNYKIWFRVYAKPGVTIDAVRAELFSSDGTHPAWVGSNPWEWNTPYTYPDWTGAEWVPVQPNEMPVTVIYTIYSG